MKFEMEIGWVGDEKITVDKKHMVGRLTMKQLTTLRMKLKKKSRPLR